MNSRQGTWLLRALIVLGCLAVVYYFSWWRTAGRIRSPWLAVALILAALYHWTQLFGNWGLYLAAHRRPVPASRPDGLTVDVFVTVCGEAPALVERTLHAACAMRGPHRTWLLDDGADPALAHLARRYGAGYLARDDRTNAKAGNINAALAQTTGDVVVIFDVDHAPAPNFLERTLGYFADPHVGFVQTMVTFANQEQSWVARAAIETGLDFYGPTSIGMDALGSATLVGTNALVRRKAMGEIGGYHPGLAEDLATSIALHAAGWHSVYVAEPLAPGVAPPDLHAWFVQQLKWARGVFEVLLTVYPRLFPRLSWGQRLAYAVRMTYYWIGPVVAIHLLFTVAVLIAGSALVQVDFQEYVVHMVPVTLCALLIRQVALHVWHGPAGTLWRAVSLVYATWPIYTAGLVLALLRVPLSFRPTPKRLQDGIHPGWLLPQLTAVLLLLTLSTYALVRGTVPSSLVLTFAILQGLPQLVVLGVAAGSIAEGRVAQEQRRWPAEGEPAPNVHQRDH